MAIKTISQFDAATPTSNDKILFEQNGEGKSATIGDAVNTCSLTLEEIQATTDLTGKIASASAVKKLYNQNMTISYRASSETTSNAIFKNVKIGHKLGAIFVANNNNQTLFAPCALFGSGTYENNYIEAAGLSISSVDNGDGTANLTISGVRPYGYFNLLVFYP